MTATLQVKLQPNAKKNEIIGFQENILKIKIHAPPVDGSANEELVSFLSEVLGVKRRNIEIKSGEKSRLKRLQITGLTESDLHLKLTAACAKSDL